jgi:hypothetical protein
VQLAEELRAITDDWNAAVHPRAGSAVKTLLDGLSRQPVVDIDHVALLCPGVAATNLHRAVNRLVDAGVLTAIRRASAIRFGERPTSSSSSNASKLT